jgi:hypothetical protein
MVAFVGSQLTLMMIPSTGLILLECARLRGTREPAERAAELIGAYVTQQTRDVVHHLERESLEETVAGLRELLGDQAYDEAHHRGTGLDADAVLPLLRASLDR